VNPTTCSPRAYNDRVLTVLGLVGLAVAVLLRAYVAGVSGARSESGGLVFGIVVCVLAAGIGLSRPRRNTWALSVGLAGGIVLCLPVLIRKLAEGTGLPVAPTADWVAIVGLVAVAEELLLRGALYDRVLRWRGQEWAIGLTTTAFALIHVPFYGWHVLPLDVAVGLWLGVLRAVAQSVTAPAAAHLVADLAAWWLQ
jgi:membrane protease YdiL (CAAX protease family)